MLEYMNRALHTKVLQLIYMLKFFILATLLCFVASNIAPFIMLPQYTTEFLKIYSFDWIMTDLGKSAMAAIPATIIAAYLKIEEDNENG